MLTTELAEPRPLAPFVLPRLAGGELRSDTLAGRVAVINLWSTTCAPCVAELPDLQALADAFAGSPDVVITSINTDPNADAIAAWMSERKLRFDVLFGGRWFDESGYRVLPTTLFVDSQGRVAFIKEGKTDRLVEEFTWRIEALRAKVRGDRKRATRSRTAGSRTP